MIFKTALVVLPCLSFLIRAADSPSHRSSYLLPQSSDGGREDDSGLGVSSLVDNEVRVESDPDSDLEEWFLIERPGTLPQPPKPKSQPKRSWNEFVLGLPGQGKTVVGSLWSSINPAKKVPKESYSEKPLDWDMLFDQEGKLVVDLDLALQHIRTSRIPKRLIPEVWVRLLGIRPWTMSDQEFAAIHILLEHNYETKSELATMELSAQIEKDIPRAQYEDTAALRKFLQVFQYDNPGYDYIQGYSTYAADCLHVYASQFGSYGLALAVFQGMMSNHLMTMFEFLEEATAEYALLIMDIIRRKNKYFYFALKEQLRIRDDVEIVAYLLQPLLMWARPIFVGTADSKDYDDHLAELHSLWMNMLSFSNPKKAIATFLATILLTNAEHFTGTEVSAYLQALTLSSGEVRFQTVEAINECIKLYN